MKPLGVSPLAFGAGPVLVLLCLAACTDEKTVYQERVLYEDPPAAAQGFLGYDFAPDDPGTGLTTCGNCHVGHQTRWEGTHHAHAWQTLQDSGHSMAQCENCHTVGPNGNSTSGAVGYAAAPEERYHDVQCESCHGPGLNHVQNPDDTAAPVAAISILDGEGHPTKNCAECHQGAHHPFADEWAQSAHAEPVEDVVSGTNASCTGCHTAQGVLKAWGSTAVYAEAGAPQAQQMGIVCAVCHDPHERENTAQLRFPIDVPDENSNLCMKCHQRRSNPDVAASTLRGPHSPEGPLLLGTAGWWPPDFSPEIDRIVASHGTTGNPRLCASCHVNKYDINDPATGSFVFHATGHLFKAIPCTDSNGKPLPADDCLSAQRTFDACANSGCHATPEAARNAYGTANARVGNLVAEVDRLLTLVPAGEFNLSDGRFTTADGSWFNAELCRRKGSPTHNPFLTEQLLIASIQAMESEYGIHASTGLSLQRMIR